MDNDESVNVVNDLMIDDVASGYEADGSQDPAAGSGSQDAGSDDTDDSDAVRPRKRIQFNLDDSSFDNDDGILKVNAAQVAGSSSQKRKTRGNKLKTSPRKISENKNKNKFYQINTDNTDPLVPHNHPYAATDIDTRYIREAILRANPDVLQSTYDHLSEVYEGLFEDAYVFPSDTDDIDDSQVPVVVEVDHDLVDPDTMYGKDLPLEDLETELKYIDDFTVPEEDSAALMGDLEDVGDMDQFHRVT
ncbi:unnamed protein product [Meganyctiphanes norvegica]|uniref:Uncharacterized protein n=1 Tax=Meganyctiphanes norvegica TaxID=48144 RepID=A0AAV2RF33_MEGNR